MLKKFRKSAGCGEISSFMHQFSAKMHAKSAQIWCGLQDRQRRCTKRRRFSEAVLTPGRGCRGRGGRLFLRAVLTGRRDFGDDPGVEFSLSAPGVRRAAVRRKVVMSRGSALFLCITIACGLLAGCSSVKTPDIDPVEMARDSVQNAVSGRMHRPLAQKPGTAGCL